MKQNEIMMLDQLNSSNHLEPGDIDFLIETLKKYTHLLNNRTDKIVFVSFEMADLWIIYNALSTIDSICTNYKGDNILWTMEWRLPTPLEKVKRHIFSFMDLPF